MLSFRAILMEHEPAASLVQAMRDEMAVRYDGLVIVDEPQIASPSVHDRSGNIGGIYTGTRIRCETGRLFVFMTRGSVVVAENRAIRG